MTTATDVISALRKEPHHLPGAFVTGSRAFGWYTESSDWDVVVRASDMAYATSRLEYLMKTATLDERHDIKASGYNDGKKGLTDYGEINLIPLHPLDMLCWFLATMEIRKLNRVLDIGDRLRSKEFKHGLFESLRGFYKTVIPYTGDTEQAMTLLKKIQYYHKKLAGKEDAAIDSVLEAFMVAGPTPWKAAFVPLPPRPLTSTLDPTIALWK